MRILVVDDEFPNVVILKKLLERDSHEVITAANGKEGVERFENLRPDIVLMDVMMPIMDGYEATQLIKEKAGQRFTPIIFITALRGDEAQVKCLEKGADDFISKPFNQTVLKAKIAAMARIQALSLTVQAQNEELLRVNNQIQEEQRLAERVYADLVNKGIVSSSIINTFHKPAELFNGDMIMAVRSPRGGINFLVGDFTGHGLAPALCAMPVVEIFHQMTSIGYSLPDIINEINHKIHQFLPRGRFLAACFFYVDGKQQSLRVWNGGMPDLFVFDKNGIKNHLTSKNLPLGILSNTDVVAGEDNMIFEQISLNEGDRIFAFSDGVIEACNGESVSFTQTRLEKLIDDNVAAGNMVDIVKEQLCHFIDENCLQDDVTMLEVNCEFGEIVKAPHRLTSITGSGNWDFDIKFDVETLRKTDPVPVMLSMLNQVHDFSSELDSLFSIISELTSNALDHGLLKLDTVLKATDDDLYQKQRQEKILQLEKGYIHFFYHYQADEQGGVLSISVEDSGDGFDIESVFNELRTDLTKQYSGLMLLSSLCGEVVFNNVGNKITVNAKWDH